MGIAQQRRYNGRPLPGRLYHYGPGRVGGVPPESGPDTSTVQGARHAAGDGQTGGTISLPDISRYRDRYTIWHTPPPSREIIPFTGRVAEVGVTEVLPEA